MVTSLPDSVRNKRKNSTIQGFPGRPIMRGCIWNTALFSHNKLAGGAVTKEGPTKSRMQNTHLSQSGRLGEAPKSAISISMAGSSQPWQASQPPTQLWYPCGATERGKGWLACQGGQFNNGLANQSDWVHQRRISLGTKQTGAWHGHRGQKNV